MRVSLIISTYNWPEALGLVLQSVKRQTVLPDEIVIADDGSKNSTRTCIKLFKKTNDISLIHVWHEDLGFRKSIILNKAISKCSGDYIIQIDGDVILHPKFISDHTKFAMKDHFLFGSRVSFSKKATLRFISNNKQVPTFFLRGLKRRGRLIYFPLINSLIKSSNKNSNKFRGCNVSYWKKDAEAINGYNEDFLGWGYEDYEFAQRLLNNNILGKRLKNIAIQYHLYHEESPKGDTSLGDKLLSNTIKNRVCYIENGIHKKVKYL